MSFELNIEDASVDYLKSNMTEVVVESLGKTNFSDEEVLNRAQRNTQGYIILQYIGSEAETPNPAFKKYKTAGKYLFYLFSKNRNNRNGIYDLLHQVKNLMINFTYENQAFTFKRDYLHPFPLDKGLFLAEIEFELIQFIQY